MTTNPGGSSDDTITMTADIRHRTEHGHYYKPDDDGNKILFRLHRCPICEEPLGKYARVSLHIATHDWGELVG